MLEALTKPSLGFEIFKKLYNLDKKTLIEICFYLQEFSPLSLILLFDDSISQRIFSD